MSTRFVSLLVQRLCRHTSPAEGECECDWLARPAAFFTAGAPAQTSTSFWAERVASLVCCCSRQAWGASWELGFRQSETMSSQENFIPCTGLLSISWKHAAGVEESDMCVHSDFCWAVVSDVLTAAAAHAPGPFFVAVAAAEAVDVVPIVAPGSPAGCVGVVVVGCLGASGAAGSSGLGSSEGTGFRAEAVRRPRRDLDCV